MSTIYKLLLKQHIGRASVPIVHEGDCVTCGERIATAQGVGADLHASVSGTILRVDAQAITIRQTASSQAVQPIPSGSIQEMVRAAGLVGMGGAGYPTALKLSQSIAGGVLIANGAECEPILAHNIVQIEETPAIIYRGLLYAMQAVGAARGIVAIKAKHVHAITSMRHVISDPRITVFPVQDIYPAGEERALIRDCLGIQVAPEKRAITANTIVLNTETLACITEAIEQRRPVVSKNLTIAGRLGGQPIVKTLFNVPIGTRIGDLLDEAGGLPEDYGEIIMDGPFMGHRVSVDDVVTKTTGGIIVTMPFLRQTSPIGLLVCACSASESRMRELAASMGAPVAAVACCKHAVVARGGLKCRNPGICPGQAERVLALRAAGAKALLIGNCTDCSNTVMSLAPRLKLPVHHITDGAMRALNLPLIRRLKRNTTALTD
ncbi:MAG: proline reductase-associated electron transfer protein PrdC [Sporolactobacillus sp.]